MKPFSILKTVVLSIALSAMSFTVSAQDSGRYVLLSGGTTTLNAASTNAFVVAGVTNQLGNPAAMAITGSNLVLNVSEFDSVGLTWKETGVVATTNGTSRLQVFKSYDGGTTWETNAAYGYTNTTPASTTGAATYTQTQKLDTSGATHLAFSMDNNASSYFTNNYLVLNLKRPKVGTYPTTK
jgi:hypothetical protein